MNGERFPKVDSCDFNSNLNNTSYANGGAVEIQEALPTFYNCRFTNNKGRRGGAVGINCTIAGTISFTKCSFSGNTSSTPGKDIYNYSATPAVTWSGTTYSEGGFYPGNTFTPPAP